MMLRKPALVLTTVAALGLAGVVPDAASAGGLGGGFNGRGVPVGSSSTPNMGRGTVAFTSQNNSNHFVGASALVTEVAVPKLDGSSKDAAYFNIRFGQPPVALQNQGCRPCAINRFR